METQSRQGLQNPGYLRGKGENGYYAGEAALTERRVGKGRVLHLGRAFSGNSLPELLTYAGVLSPFMELIEADGSDAELSLRQKNGRYFLFVLNFRPVEISFMKKKSPARRRCRPSVLPSTKSCDGSTRNLREAALPLW